ncbi:MAG TPA: cytochrome c-type biogenesis protein CcmH [Bryobacteraceae bacterium]|nr:cytochrome c-type biogenesis protein CcmH [Bryobacteraceae bacterium]
MLKSKSRLLVTFLLAGICLPQTATRLVTPEIRRVGDKLACKCGACNNTVATCQMLECHYSLPARERIATMQKAGTSDDAIVDTFVKEGGLAALAAPPREGFNLLAWVMPFVAISLGLMFIFVWFKRFAGRRAAEVRATPEIDPRYQQRMDRELEDLE